MKNINNEIDYNLIHRLRKQLIELQASMYVYNTLNIDIGAKIENIMRFDISDSINEALIENLK